MAQPIDGVGANRAVSVDAGSGGHRADVRMRGVDAAVDDGDADAAAGDARVVGEADHAGAEPGEPHPHTLARDTARAKSRANGPSARESASGVPVCTSRAPSTTATWSAARATASRCEMTIEVRPRITAW